MENNNNTNTSGAGPPNQIQNQNQSQLPAAGAARLPPQHQPSLIRTDQVQKLPHLNEQQKASHTQLVRSFWEILNSRPTNSPEYQTAHNKLGQVSQNLMRGMRMFQQTRQQQQAQQAQQQAQQQPQQQAQQQPQQQQGQRGPPPVQQPQAQQGQQQVQQAQAQQQQRQPPNNPQQAQQQAQAAIGRPGQQPGVNPEQRAPPPVPQSLQKLFPHVQQKVNSLTFVLPPAISKEQTEGWLPEAKLRYGMALQKQEIGKMKLNDLRQQYTQRQSAGNLTQEEIQEFKNRQVAAENMAREGTDFLNKFKEQQESFKAQQQNQLNNRAGQNIPAQGQPGVGQGDQMADVNRPQGVQNQMRGPAPHTINSAVAARHQADQAALSPSTTTQPGQAPSQTPGQISQAMSQPLAQTPQSATQPPASQPLQHDPSSAATAMPHQQPQQQQNAQGTPRPLSQQAAMAQAAQSYSQQNPPSVASGGSSHAHPQGYLGNRGNDHSTRNINMPIPKNLNVPPPAQVSMGPARPTLSGGPSQGSSGVMGQPAIQKHPGYVLEGDGQRVLSKKMLDTLVKQVTGGGEGEGLTPDAEEFILQMADDFVDDVITAACRLAKLRPSSTLDIRDIQLVLERNYNIRIPGFSSDDLRTVKKPQPTQGWTQKMSAVQAAKVTQGKAE